MAHRKRKQGCLSGCLVRILMTLGLMAILFVGACQLGFIRNDPQTGAPYWNPDALEDLSAENLPDLPSFSTSIFSNPSNPSSLSKRSNWLPSGWNSQGMSVKSLGESVLVRSNGRTMLVGGGCNLFQLLLCGVTQLDAVIVTDCAKLDGLPLIVRVLPPSYLLYPDTQTKNDAYHRLMDAAEANPTRVQRLVPHAGTAFDLGQAHVTVIGPVYTFHTDEGDDGLTLRIEDEQTRVLIAGNISQTGEMEILRWLRQNELDPHVDLLIASRGGADGATCEQWIQSLSPTLAWLTGSASLAVQDRLNQAGVQVR